MHGTSVGSEVGLHVGGVGRSVGVPVGTLVGSAVGVTDGEADGADDGASVGVDLTAMYHQRPIGGRLRTALRRPTAALRLYVNPRPRPAVGSPAFSVV